MSRVTAKIARDRMERAREDEAGKLLASAKVAERIGAAAGAGLGLVMFAPPAGVSIKSTATAAAMIEELTAAGFRCAWIERRDPGDLLNHELAVSWDAASLG